MVAGLFLQRSLKLERVGVSKLLNKVFSDYKYREQVIEYLFVSELMLALGKRGLKLELLRVHTDSFGYDLILKCREVIRYVQIKSREKTGRNIHFDVQKSLIRDNNGAIVLVLLQTNKDELKLKYRLYVGHYRKKVLANEPKYKADKDKFCCLTIGNFEPISDINELAIKLFDLHQTKESGLST